MSRKEFLVTIQYFKPSGKFYTSEKAWIEAEYLNERSAYMIEIVTAIKTMKQLPGLQSGSWDGPIYLNCEEGYPCLIL